LVETAFGETSLLIMWEPLVALRSQNKPVDLLMIDGEAEHILSKPSAQMYSQGGTVDWFRFWLQDYEDPDPAKAEQYRRCEGLRALRDKNAAVAKAH
jgi:hypothetical protein